MDENDRFAEAEQNALQATFILNTLQANKQVYGSNSMLTGARPADVDLGLRYINRALEDYPDQPGYLNIKALLLIDSGMDKAKGIELLQHAHNLNPRDITIESNLEKAKAGACFVATAVYGSDTCEEVLALRRWRDTFLLRTGLGRRLVQVYYRYGPSVACVLLRRPRLSGFVRRMIISPLVSVVSKRQYRRRPA